MLRGWPKKGKKKKLVRAPWRRRGKRQFSTKSEKRMRRKQGASWKWTEWTKPVLSHGKLVHIFLPSTPISRRKKQKCGCVDINCDAGDACDTVKHIVIHKACKLNQKMSCEQSNDFVPCSFEQQYSPLWMLTSAKFSVPSVLLKHYWYDVNEFLPQDKFMKTVSFPLMFSFHYVQNKKGAVAGGRPDKTMLVWQMSEA